MRLTVVTKTRTRISFGPGRGTGTSRSESVSGGPYRLKTIAFIICVLVILPVYQIEYALPDFFELEFILTGSPFHAQCGLMFLAQ